jgi:hypothetical protein
MEENDKENSQEVATISDSKNNRLFLIVLHILVYSTVILFSPMKKLLILYLFSPPKQGQNVVSSRSFYSSIHRERTKRHNYPKRMAFRHTHERSFNTVATAVQRHRRFHGCGVFFWRKLPQTGRKEMDSNSS